MLITAAILAILALPLLIVGLRGRRVDDHPVCQKCRFDLDGLYPKIDICPECGSSLSTPADPATTGSRRGKAQPVRVGNRKRRPAFIAVGLLTLVLSIGIVLGSAANFNWDRYKPYAMLSAELRYIVRSADTARTQEILTEILDRVTAGTLDADLLDPLVNRALEIQADPNANWVVAWGDLIDAYDAAVGLDPDRLAAYLRVSVIETVTIRSSVRSGDDMPIEYRNSSPRLGTARTVTVLRRVAGGSIGGRPLPAFMGTTGSALAGGRIGSSSGARTMIRLGYPPIEPGQHDFILELEYTLKEGWANDAAVIASWTETVSTSIEITPRTDGDIAMVHKDGSADWVAVPRGTFKMKKLSVGLDGRGQFGFNGQMQLTGVYVPCAFDVFIVGTDVGTDKIDGSQGIPLGTVSFKPPDVDLGAGKWGFGLFGKVPPGFDATTVNIVLRPSRDAARATIGLNRIWGGEILIENVPIEWPDEPDPP